MIGTRSRKGKVVQATTRQLVEQVLYAKNEDGKFKATITDYWDRVVCRVNPNYGRHSFQRGDRRVVCPFHDDIAPSLGLVIDKETGVEVYNCFGCGVSGTIVGFHEAFYKKAGMMSSNNSLDYLRKLASLYKIPLQSQITEIQSEKTAEIDFNRTPSYNIRMHKDNVRTVKNARSRLGVRGIAQNWDLLTEKVLSIKKG